MQKLKEGDRAPGFSANDQYGRPVRLEDYRGKKVVLYFYPKDNTPGCTAEACSLRDHHDVFLENGYAVIGVSADDAASHVKFTEKHGLPFPLIPDTGREIIKAYGVWGPKKFMGREFEGIIRTTFVIGEDGRIEKIFTKVKTTEHGEQILGAEK